uniref:ATP-dependent RNA helicase DHX40 n=1 Tax=Anisakis simplex TaxID=6269 RepID=A0A0M3JY48_ANISI
LALDGIIADEMRVLCTAPRKLAARSVAHYVSRELQNTKYFASAKIEGFLTCAQAKFIICAKRALLWRIVFITPWHLLKELRENEMLKEYGCVMIDEAHERSIDGDLCLSVIKRIMRSREDLKLVITSASMDEGVFKKYFDEFGVATLSITNRQYPVEIKYALLVLIILKKVTNFSPSEVQDAEIRLQKILTGIQYPAHVEILSLHGRMNRREQSRACAPCHGDCLFRVLFATNVAEASLTIPNVRYVIDCGLAKRERYDAIRETSIIQLGRISKSEAQQRTGRICYRLYSEEDYETMEKVPIPEIMRKNLDSVLLYLLSVGVEKPETFDFIGESIGKERFQQSYTTLTSLQAVESSGGILSLTQMGRQMTAFPIPPTLSYMILESKKYSIVPEMAVICACINIRSIFSYRRSQEGKYRADSVRLRLNDEFGDPLTYLRNILNCYVIFQEQYYAFNCERYEFGIDGVAQVVRRLFCEVFKRNVAVYSGSLQGGYINMATEERVWIHPASSLRQLGVTPEYIVYEYAHCTSRLFANDVMQADADWVKSVVSDHVLKRIEEVLFECWRVIDIVRFLKIHIGAGAIAKEILLRGEYCTIFAGRGHKYFDWRINTKFLHDELYPHFEKYGKITSVVCFREFLHERTGCACKIRFDNKEIARRVVEAHVDDSDWGVSVYVEPESVKKVNISQVYDFQRFFIDVRWRRRKSHRCGKALLPNISFEQLQRLGERLAREHFPSQVETHYGHHQSLFDEQTDSLRWDQAPPEIFFREMDEEMTSEELHERIEPHCRALNIDLKADCVFVIYDKSYPPESGEKLREYKERISSYLERLGMESKIIPESIEPAPSTSMQSEIDHVNNRELPFDIEIDPVKRASDLEITARVHFLNVDIGRRFMSAVERNVESTGVPLSMGDVVVDSVKMRECYEIGFEMSKRLLTSLYDDLADLEQRIQRSGIIIGMSQFTPIIPRLISLACITTTMNNKPFCRRVCEAHQQLRALVEGITLDCRDANERRRAGEQSLVEQPYYKLLSDGARMFNQIRKNISEEVIVTFVQLEKLIRLQGSRELIKETKQIIDDFLEDRFFLRIRLNPPCYRYGITMALLKEFGDENLQRLAVEIGSNVQLRLRMPMQQLYFYGIEAEYDKLLEWLRDFSERLPPTDELSDVEPLTCAICTCAPNSESFYCFEACGHYACIECLNNQFLRRYEVYGDFFLIQCFQQLMMDGRKRNLMSIRGLIDSSLTFYMNRNIDKYRPCITPNCRGIHQVHFVPVTANFTIIDLERSFKVTPEPNLHACTLCRRELCSHCGNESHGKLSCEEYGRIRSSADESIVQWIEKDPDHRRRCPKCGTVIEKEAGCNHMQCEKCKIHFCWLCPFSVIYPFFLFNSFFLIITAKITMAAVELLTWNQFQHEESGAVYAHLQDEHGGLGADLEALLQDIDDPAQARRLMAELRNQGAMAADVWDDELVDDDEWFEDEPWTLEQGDEDLGFDLADNIGDGLDEMDMWSEDYEDIGQDFVDDFDGDDVDLPDEVDHMDMDHLEDDLNSDDNGISIWDDGQTETEYE